MTPENAPNSQPTAPHAHAGDQRDSWRTDALNQSVTVDLTPVQLKEPVGRQVGLSLWEAPTQFLGSLENQMLVATASGNFKTRR